MMVHHLPGFFSSPAAATGLGPVALEASPSSSTVAGTLSVFAGDTNSPSALSKEARPSTVFQLENQPPGKNREEVVESSRARGMEGESSSSVTLQEAISKGFNGNSQ